MTRLAKIIAYELHPLSEAIGLWVDYWKPDALIKEYKSNPEKFIGLPKSKSKVLYRLVYLTKPQLIALQSGKVLPPKTTLESWSINSDLDKVGEGQASHGKKPGMYAVILKKAIPIKEQIVFIPAAHRVAFISSKLSADYIKREGEVITKGQEISVNNVFTIKDPLTKKPIKIKDFGKQASQAPLWESKKKAAMKMAKDFMERKDIPMFPEKLGDGFVLEFYSDTSFGIREVKTSIRQIWNSGKNVWEMA